MKSTRFLIVVDDLADWQSDWTGYPVISTEDYLTSADYLAPGYRVINLCRHGRTLSMGYYTSLLAEARGHRAMATARTLQNLNSKRIYGESIGELTDQIQKSLARIVHEDFSLSIYFGQNLAATHARLAQTLFTLFPCPLFKVDFRYQDHGWEIHQLRPLGLGQVPRSHLFKVKEAMDAFLSRRWRSYREREEQGTGIDLAILHQPGDKQPPSNSRALRHFVRAAESLNANVEFITRTDYPRLLEFDALFIRETTSLTNHTYRFATKATREGMAVIDDPDSIRRCCNKIYLHELLRVNRIRVPRTEILYPGNVDTLPERLGLPLVIKVPDSAFSLGVFKAETEADLRRMSRQLLRDSDLLIAQEFLPTEYDWRVGVLDREPLFVCRYYMSKDHWQIYNPGKSDDSGGDFDTIPVEEAPPEVIRTALAAANLIGDGLYGVDLKQRGEEVYVIEVNDNPNVDAGIEDLVLGQQLYVRIIQSLIRRVEKIKMAPVAGRPTLTDSAVALP
ncbi:MAG: RimK family alpha-L-glutamate ligase [Puniceicoccaceae bacterium]|nr:MAG: RimK family alpha-L-glutamate ligase [Puniceicoccaceae bacterium]